MFEALPALPADPILGLMLAHKADPNPNKVDLGAGVYKNDQGHTPIMSAVLESQSIWAEQEDTKSYGPQAGFDGFNEGIKRLLLGDDNRLLNEGRVISVQAPGGSGALRIAAGMMLRCQKDVKLWVSTPTWANHIPLLGGAGLELVEYPYYDRQLHAIDFDAMMDALSKVEPGDFILLHGCCHNPCGADLSKAQWQALAKLCQERGAIPFVDMAYQGLADGLDEDAWGLRHIAEHCPEMIIVASCSKNFGLYRERVGAALVVAKDQSTAEICKSQLMNIARELYSLPPTHGAAIVEIILNDPKLSQLWKDEVVQVRERINSMRALFVDCLQKAGAGDQFDYIKNEKGMFSFLGISPEQVKQLKDKNSIYMVGSSRINIAGLTQNNMQYVVDSLMSVL
jgi:aspartate aminotransferase